MSFARTYHEDRAAFVAAVRQLAERSGRTLTLHSHVVDAAEDLCVTLAELPAKSPERLYLLTTGIHGLEGYTGTAVARSLCDGALARLSAATTSLVLVHALNPYGMARFLRVNQHNVDLNRNCQVQGEALFATDSSAYRALAPVLAPKRKARDGLTARAAFRLRMLRALAKHGMRTLRQATLGGQYVDPQGIFYGGAQLQPELAFFQAHYERLAQQHAEVLLTDMHTGYGERGLAYPLFGQADSPEFASYAREGVKDESGRDRTYTVHGDLVGYVYKTHKRLQPAGICNGVVVEIGTHGLSTFAQIQDLYAVVRENQARHHGARTPQIAQRAHAAFRELFYPSEAAWQERATAASSARIEDLLRKRNYL